MISTTWHSLTCLELSTDELLCPTLFQKLKQARDQFSERVDGVVASYRSVACYWSEPPLDPKSTVVDLEEQFREILAGDDSLEAVQTHRIQVAYDGDDLNDVAETNDLTVSEVIQVHAAEEYVVAAIGFQPHFGYLWGLSESLVTPRRATPRTRVPAGVVAIGGDQTGIYPRESPGGWNIIGRVIDDGRPWERLQVGDAVRFEAVEALL